MAALRTLGLFVIWLLIPSLAYSAPPGAPEEDLPISPRPVVPQPRPIPDGDASACLNLDAAIDRLVRFNYGLQTRFQDIRESRADELTAGLFNPPALFLSGNPFPYGRYSPQRPGATGYEVSPVANIDYSGKRRSRIREARLETREIEARYQDAVRMEIDRLYDAYVDVLEARERAQAAQSDLQRVAELAAMNRRGRETEADRITLSRFNAEGDVRDAEIEFTQRKRQLAALLALPPDKADDLEITGFLEDRFPPPPSLDELIRLALEYRPDVAAQRLGSERDQALVRVTQAERFDNAAVFYSPYEIQNNSPQGKQSSLGWGGGAFFSVPIVDRNQGVIARARINLKQGQIEVDGIERMAANDVRQALAEYTVSREIVQQYEREGLPAVRSVFEEEFRLYNEGKEGIDAVLEARKDYREMVRLYREALVRHRRSMLKLNTAVGKRILP